MRVRMLLAGAAFAAASFAVVGAAQAQVFVVDTPSATRCSMAANAPTRDDSSIARCTLAIDSDGLVGRNLAGTYTNRGVLRLRAGDASAAMADFDKALDMDQSLGEAWIDRGAGLLAQARYDEAVQAVNRGLPLTRRGHEMAYYIRAVARENLNDDTGAYRDFMQASRTAPAWDAPRTDIARFEVRPR